MQTKFGHGIRRGALIGFIVGLGALSGALAVSIGCLSYRISFPPPPLPWYCTDPVNGWLGYLAFPVNVLTNDLSRAILLAPLSLVMYVVLGALLGTGQHRGRWESSPCGR